MATNPVSFDGAPGALLLRPPRPGPGSVAWRIHAERIMLASWGRAILLQFAHPLVAAGVAEHSQFGVTPAHNRARLFRTVQAMLDLTFGADERAARAADRIDTIHGRIQGRLAEPAGALALATPYAARMPELLLWVHATMLDSALLVYERFVGPLSPAEQDRYCDESRALGPLLGLPAAMIPATRAALDAYMTEMYGNGQIAVGETARRLKSQLLQARPAGFVRGPLLALLHLPTVGLLPPALRAAYGLDWTPRQAALLRVTGATSRRLLPLLPPSLRYWPIARAAMRGDDRRQA
jgi:uncharacterized protein (DUF2236 family)